MIEANLAYAALTGNRAYIVEACRIASRTAALHPAPWHTRGMAAVFDAIYYQALDRLDLTSPGAASLAGARDYLRWAWPKAQAPRRQVNEDNLFEQAAFIIDAAVLAG